MTKFVEAECADDGTVYLKDEREHEWTVSFAGERPLIEQVFSDKPVSDPPPAETDEETEDKE